MRKFWIFALLLMATPSWGEDEALSNIEDNCKAEWPSDYPTQEYCIDRQVEALKNLEKIRNGQQNSEEKAILSLCLAEWGKEVGADWAMVEYCYNQQHEAYEKRKAG